MRISRLATTMAAAAALSMTASPVLADGWGGYGHRERHDDTGWIVGGLLGIGLIAAIAASSSNKNRRDREARDRDYNNQDGDYRDGGDYRDQGSRYGDNRDQDSRPAYSGSNRGIDSAVDACVGEVERSNGGQVESVDSVGREGGSWRIYGRVSGARDFSCSVDGAGQVHEVSVTARGN